MERKFVVADLAGMRERLAVANPVPAPVSIRQGYLAEEHDVELRLRITDVGSVITIKAGSGLHRTEVECTITDADARSLWPRTVGRRLEKVRHRVDLGDLTAEVDVYGGALDGLVVVEVEFTSAATADAFTPPDWFGDEVTGMREWSNAALARHGRPRS
ncbi:MAG: adenylate cyclase [Acidimicrobiales bacterium]|nr:adenylate cyclase [Acidimicrobiales bacterium]